MIGITGVSRGGTSMMMDICRHAGLDILGTAFGETKKPKTPEQKCLAYMHKAIKADKDMNPNGFWESKYAVHGIHYRLNDADNLHNLEIKHSTVFKVVARGLVHSDPKYIDKLILMSRNPHEIATSQKRLKRNMPIEVNGDINNPELYIKWGLGMCSWLAKYQHIPVLVVRYEELFTNTLRVLSDIQDFLGIGDFSKSVDVINPKLYRSHYEDVPSNVWDIAEKMYDLVNQKKFKEVTELSFKRLNSWRCARCGILVNHTRCKQCRNDEIVMYNFREQAVRSGIDFTKEPCLFECGLGELDKYISIKQSIKENFWNE